jgi:hypothetical protein
MNPYPPGYNQPGGVHYAQGESNQPWNGLRSVMQDIEASALSVTFELNRLAETLDVLGKMATDLEGRIVGFRPMADAPGSAAVPPPGILGSVTACANRAEHLRSLLSRLMEQV